LVALYVAPTASPSTGSGVIAFVRGGDVWTIDPATTRVERNLTAGEQGTSGRAGPISWSPGGSRLLYAAFAPGSPTGHWIVEAMGPDGSSKHTVVSDPTRSWSPVCWLGPELVALVAFPLGGISSQPSDYYVARADGSGLRPITSGGLGGLGRLAYAQDVCSPAAGLVFPISGADWYSVSVDGTRRTLDLTAGSVSPSPDGTRLAWLGDDGLFVTGIDGTNRTKIAEAPTASWQYLGPAQWSRDGTEIAFPSAVQNCCSDDEPSYYSSVHVIAASGAGERQLSFRPKERATPLAWSPDGTRILFQADPGFDFLGQRLFVMNADGTCRTQLALFSGIPNELSQGVVWQPVPGKAPDGRIVCPAHVGLVGDEFAGDTWLRRATPYTVSVTNEGSMDAEDVQVSVSNQTWLEVRSMGTSHGPCDASGCALGTMRPAESASVTMTLTGTISDFPDSATGHFILHVSSTGSNDSLTVHAEVYGCRSVGTYGSDTFLGTGTSDSFCGLTGTDSIYGRKGNDQLAGGPDTDYIYGGPGRDLIYGESGDDTIHARDGQRDRIDCGRGGDRAVVDRKDSVNGCEKVLRGRH
jgi:Ca2+-binding RTX toxin-like protein